DRDRRRLLPGEGSRRPGGHLCPARRDRDAKGRNGDLPTAVGGLLGPHRRGAAPELRGRSRAAAPLAADLPAEGSGAMIEALAQFHFARPWWLLALPPAFALFILARRGASAAELWAGLIEPKLLEHLIIGPEMKRKIIPVDVLLAA